MKKSEVKIGAYYLAKISNNVVPVRIIRAAERGWWAINTVTGREVRIKSAAKLRKEVPPEKVEKIKRIVSAPTIPAAIEASKACPQCGSKDGYSNSDCSVCGAVSKPAPTTEDAVNSKIQEMASALNNLRTDVPKPSQREQLEAIIGMRLENWVKKFLCDIGEYEQWDSPSEEGFTITLPAHIVHAARLVGEYL